MASGAPPPYSSVVVKDDGNSSSTTAPPSYGTSSATPATPAASPSASSSSGTSWKDKLKASTQKASVTMAALGSSTLAKASDVLATASKNASLIAGLKYSTESFRAAYEFDVDQPLICSWRCSILVGAVLENGQVYLTPDYMCLYMVLNGKEVKPKIPLRTIARITEGVGKTPPTGPVVEDCNGQAPNSLLVFTDDNTVHTMIHVTPYGKSINCVSYVWSFMMKTPELSFPTVKAAFHDLFDLELTEREMANFACKVVTGNTGTYTTVYISENLIAFKIGDYKAFIRLSEVDRLVLCISMQNPDPAIKVSVLAPVSGDVKPTAVQLYTNDNVIHQFYNCEDLVRFYNLITYGATRARGGQSVAAFI